jgi:hypothetical protein
MTPVVRWFDEIRLSDCEVCAAAEAGVGLVGLVPSCRIVGSGQRGSQFRGPTALPPGRENGTFPNRDRQPD